MANHKSAEKRARQAIGRNARNSATEGAVRTVEKRIHAAIANGDSTTAQTLLSEYSGKITRAATKGVLHAKTASRKMSRLASRIHQIGKPGAVKVKAAKAAPKAEAKTDVKAASKAAPKTAAKAAPKKAAKTASKSATK